MPKKNDIIHLKMAVQEVFANSDEESLAESLQNKINLLESKLAEIKAVTDDLCSINYDDFTKDMAWRGISKIDRILS